MNYRNIEIDNKSIQDIAQECLRAMQISTFPISVKTLCQKCKESKITMVPYSAKEAKYLAGLVGVGDWVDRTDGFAVQVAGKSVIFWNDHRSKERQRSTIAHELGHLILHHTEPNHSCCKECNDCQENHANLFAFNFLYPNTMP